MIGGATATGGRVARPIGDDLHVVDNRHVVVEIAIPIVDQPSGQGSGRGMVNRDAGPVNNKIRSRHTLR